MLEAIFYVVGGVIAWRQVPADFPPAMTICDIFHRWAKAGVWQRVTTPRVTGSGSTPGVTRCPPPRSSTPRQSAAPTPCPQPAPATTRARKPRAETTHRHRHPGVTSRRHRDRRTHPRPRRRTPPTRGTTRLASPRRSTRCWSPTRSCYRHGRRTGPSVSTAGSRRRRTPASPSR
ncbi:MAG TPA: transposase [Mycobacteriales bacterium]